MGDEVAAFLELEADLARREAEAVRRCAAAVMANEAEAAERMEEVQQRFGEKILGVAMRDVMPDAVKSTAAAAQQTHAAGPAELVRRPVQRLQAELRASQAVGPPPETLVG